jgi:hypothetical protein
VAEPEQHRDRPTRDDLPAVYVSPWGLLRRDLLAVLATLRLGAWQVWRRNRQGDLPRPEFWPQALAGWFWPVLLGLLLSVLLAGVWGLAKARSFRPPQGAPAPQTLAGQPPAGQVPSPEPGLGEAAAEGLISEAPSAVETPVEEPLVEDPIAEPEPPQDPEADQPDPLLQAFAGERQVELLLAARVRAPDGDLELVLDQPGWQRLPAAERQGLAEQWQLRAESLGYARLWLLDPQKVPLARSARVGSGMILLAPSSPAHAPGSRLPAAVVGAAPGG